MEDRSAGHGDRVIMPNVHIRSMQAKIILDSILPDICYKADLPSLTDWISRDGRLWAEPTTHEGKSHVNSINRALKSVSQRYKTEDIGLLTDPITCEMSCPIMRVWHSGGPKITFYNIFGPVTMWQLKTLTAMKNHDPFIVLVGRDHSLKYASFHVKPMMAVDLTAPKSKIKAQMTDLLSLGARLENSVHA